MISLLYRDAIRPLGAEPSSLPGSGADGPAMRWLLGISVVTGVVYIAFDGALFYPTAVILALGILFVTFHRLELGLASFVGMVLLFDEVPPRGYETSIVGTEYYQNLKSIPILANVNFAVLTPLELHLLAVIFIWIVLIALKRRTLNAKLDHRFAILGFFGWLAFSTAHGLATGGDFLPSLWETRALFYMCIMFFLVPQIIESKDQVRNLVWVIILALTFKVVQGSARLVRLGFEFGGRTELTNHEDPLFFISLFSLLICFVLFKVRTRQKTYLFWLLFPMLLVFIFAQRRATYVALGVSIIIILTLLTRKQQLATLKLFVPLAVLAVAYLVSFWDSDSTAGIPAKLFRSSISSTKEDAGERYYSNLYREFENYNLAQTIQRSPVIGIGFGNKYDQPVKLPRIPFPLSEYIPHNEIFWLVIKTGAVGFFLFLFFANSIISTAVRTFLDAGDPYLKSISVVVVVAFVGQIVVSFFDLQLTYYRNMVFLGTIIGLLNPIRRLQAPEPVAGRRP